MTVRAENVEPLDDQPGGFSGLDWGFFVQPYSATTDIDDYEEGDAGAVGQRSKMGDGSGSTGWRYDKRGRLVDETKVVDGTPGGTFVTQYDYYAGDQVKDMWYPGGNAGETGEKVTFTYHPQGLVDSVEGNNIFVKSSSYDAAGRLTQRVLGNYAITRSYSYYLWGTANGWGRLSAMTAGTLQDLDYVYDPNGNIIQIDDNLAGSPQRQSFTYDGLDRLTSASASGGSGGAYTLENYLYDSSSGNLSSKAGVSYTYSNGSTPPGHNVTSTSNGWTFEYDANGNMTSRVNGGTSYTQAYDVENRLVSVSNGGGVEIASFDYDGDGNRVKGTVGDVTTVYVGDYYELSTQETNISPIDVTPLNNGVACLDGATGSGYIMYSAESVHTRFSAHPPHASNADHFICVKYDGSDWEYDNNVSYYPLTLAESDILVAAVDFTNDTVTSLEGQDSVQNGIAYGYASGNLAFTANRWGGNPNSGEFEITGTNFTPNKLVIARRYYYAGGQRVSLRENGTIAFLLDDHLGSTAVTTDVLGGFQAEVRYKPWGENRYITGTTPTTFRFTGQRQEADLGGVAGLYFYKARWYDAALGCFIQADTVVPDPYYPLDWDRFAYARNNPVKFIDPTGHTVCTPDQPGCRKGYSNGLSPEQQFRKEIKKNFGWWVDPRFSIKQLRNIWRTGSDISRYVESVDPTKSGRDWVKLYMGNANLVLGGIPQNFVSRFNDVPTSVVFLKHTIWLSHSFDKMNLAHELAHVWDNNSVSLPDATATWEGFGIADQLTLFVGGTPTGWRWSNNPSGIPLENQWKPYVNNGYGNESTADYFAESVKDSIYEPGYLPQPWIQTWLNAIIYLQP